VFDRLQRAIAWIATPEGPPIEAWRRRILAAVLLGVCLLGLFAYIVGAAAAYRAGQHGVVIVDTVGYAIVLIITVGRRLPYALRAGVLTMMPAVLGTFFLYYFGFVAAGFPWLLTFPIFASVLLGLRAGLWACGVLAVILGLLGMLIPTGVMSWAAGMDMAQTMWWVSSSSVLTLAALVSLSTGYLFDGLGREAEARQAAVLEIDRRERLASLGTLTGGIAHDFNNLLQPIVSDAEHARRLVPEGHEALPLLDDILLSAHRARTLVRRILSFARPTTNREREVVNLGALVNESERLLRAVLPANVDLVTTIADDVQVVAQAAELQQVLLNLVTNAAHSMRRGGTVSLQVQQVAGNAALAGTTLADSSPLAMLVVSDTGAGMSRETLARAFEPFFTTKQPGHGTGLGLATVHATVTAMGGIVRAESEMGIGTRMQVWLPVASATLSEPSSIVRLRPAMNDAAAMHVVVVDDEPAVLLATARLIERLGYSVTRFDRPALLLDQLDQLDPTPHIVLTDLSMPLLTGWELAAALHARWPSLPIVVMTGNLDVGEGADAVEGERSLDDRRRDTGVVAVLSKPFSVTELRAALQHAHADRIGDRR
jgi:signal transduction histidine kinase/ActR/RegA family two-component response regulator